MYDMIQIYYIYRINDYHYMTGAMDQQRAMVKNKRWIREGALDGTCDRSVSNR